MLKNEKKGILCTPIRMCIVCRKRVEQKNLFRLQIKAGEVVKFTGFGRSFYLCELCAQKDTKVLQKAFSKIYNGIIQPNFKEILLDDKG